MTAKPQSPIADAARAALEAALADGAVSVVIISENRKRQCVTRTVPNTESIRIGLLVWATNPFD